MKRNFIFVFAVLCGTLLPPFTASGQTYFDFALATDGQTASASNSIIRAVGNDKALVYYETSTDHYLAVIDTYGAVNRVSIGQNYMVRDMRYCNNTVFLCGTYLNQAFLLCVPYNDVATSTGSTITSFFISPLVTLTRMVVFTEPSTGVEKIIAVGEEVYQPCPTPTSFYSCADRVVLECTYQIGTIMIDASRITNDANHKEYVTEVIETDSYVALVGYFSDKSAISIHRCIKGPSVLASDFDNFFYYPGTSGDGCSIFHGCRMKEDTIAIASLSVRELAPTHKFETRIRTFDLQTMAMTTAQAIDLDEDKAEPEELVYLPQYQTLVMLQDFNFPTPASGHNYAFLHLKPYIASNYNANGWVEINTNPNPNPPLSYRSVDWLYDKFYISSGGNYWLMKNSLLDVTTTGCYDCHKIKVKNIKTFSPEMHFHSNTTNVYAGGPPITLIGNYQMMNSLCIIQ